MRELVIVPTLLLDQRLHQTRWRWWWWWWWVHEYSDHHSPPDTPSLLKVPLLSNDAASQPAMRTGALRANPSTYPTITTTTSTRTPGGPGTGRIFTSGIETQSTRMIQSAPLKVTSKVPHLVTLESPYDKVAAMILNPAAPKIHHLVVQRG